MIAERLDIQPMKVYDRLSSTTMNPPKAPLIFRVGVTGHLLPDDEKDLRPDPAKRRPRPDVPHLRSIIREILEHIRDAVEGVRQANGAMFDLGPPDYRPHHGALRVVSALAKGADQWIAAEAVELGYELQSPLPFRRDEYEKDFNGSKDAEARQEFRRLLAKATAVLELDGHVEVAGTRQPLSAAYEAVGRAILDQTDLLIAVWDGDAPQGRGGTGAVVEEALQRGIPVVWVTWSQPEKWVLRLPEWRLLQRSADIRGDAERLKEQVRELLLPPDEDNGTENHRPITRDKYFSETQKRFNPVQGWWWVLAAVISLEIFRPKNLKRILTLEPFRVADFEKTTRADWRAACRGTLLDANQPHPAAPELANAVERAYLRHYAWANHLSIYYGNLYRSTFAMSYLLMTLGVCFALVPMAMGWTDRRAARWFEAELAAIAIAVGLTLFGGWRRHWHERWIDYRMLAERLRLSRCLILFGGGGQPVSLPAHLATYGNPAATWMHWHYRAVERAAALPNVRFTGDYLAASKQFWLTNLIQDQITYHKNIRVLYRRMEHNLHAVGWVLLAATVIVCGWHVSKAYRGESGTDSPTRWLTLAAAALPALGAALSGIRTQAEIHRLERRSQAMERRLAQIKIDLASLPTDANEGHSQRLRLVVSRATDLMAREMLDWRVVLLDQPLETHA